MTPTPPDPSQSADLSTDDPAVVEGLSLRRRKRLMWLSVFVGVAGLWAAWNFWLVPGHLTQRYGADRRCLEVFLSSGEGEPLACVQETGLYWWLITHSSTHAAEAQEQQQDATNATYDAELLRHAVVNLDPVAAQRAAEQYKAHTTPDTLAALGLHELLIAQTLHQVLPENAEALDAAITFADLNAAQSLRFTTAPSTAPFDIYKRELKIGVLRCLQGDTEAGLAFLQSAERYWLKVMPNTYDEAHTAKTACGGGPEGREGLPVSSRAKSLTKLLNTLNNPSPSASPFAQRRALLGPAGRRELLSPPEYALRVALNEMPGDMVKGGRELPLDPAAYDEAVKRLLQLAEAANQELDALTQQASDGSYDAEETARQLRRDVDGLKHAAGAILYNSALDAVRNNDPQRARQQVLLLETVLPSNMKYILMLPLLLAGSADEALRVLTETGGLEGWPLEADANDKAAVWFLASNVLAAWTLAEVGRVDDAYTRLDQAYRRVLPRFDKWKKWPDDLKESAASAAWMRAALALRAGKAPDSLGLVGVDEVGLPKDRPWLISDRSWFLAWLLTYRAASVDHRRVMRLRLHKKYQSGTAYLPEGVLPAVVYVAAAIGDADTQGDPHKRALWLNLVLPERSSGSKRLGWWAHATAARWRKDPEAAKAWDDRIEPWLALRRRDFPSAVLVDLLIEERF